MAQIEKLGKQRYRVTIFLGRDPQTQKRNFYCKIIHGTLAEAEDYARDKGRERRMGVMVLPSKTTFLEFLRKWLEESARHRIEPNTYEHYSEMVTRYIKPHPIGKKSVSKLQPSDIQTLYNEMLKTVSGRTVRMMHSVLSPALKQAAKWRLIGQNPASLVDLPKKQRKEMKALSSDQARAFLEAVATDRYFAAFALVLETGLRPSEYLGLQREDVDFQGAALTVKRKIIWLRNGEYYLGEPKTAKSRRRIPLSSHLLGILRHHLAVQGEERLKAGQTYQDKGFLFASVKGLPLRPHNLIMRHFKPALKTAELPADLRIYDLRHSCATILLEAQEHPKIVADRLGHSSVTQTLDTYSHVLPGMQERATEAISSRLFDTLSTNSPPEKKKSPESGS